SVRIYCQKPDSFYRFTEILSRAGLNERAGRELTPADLEQLLTLGAVHLDDENYVVAPIFDVSVALLDLDVSPETIRAAANIISDSMHSMVLQLNGVMRTGVVEPFRQLHEHLDPETAERFENTLRSLRQLTLDAVVAQFQVALNHLAAPDRRSR
ncbi:MAG TPA: hypothetical protein VN108_09675, partial [Marmoricola sp.]|nr:hypothetical protein [Marmoricola sp.]